MAPNRGSGLRHQTRPQYTTNRSLKRKREGEDIESLCQNVLDLEPKPASPFESFSQLPLSQATRTGLEASHFTELTPIQACGIPLSLKGRDILGSAKTGSGKTLAFIVPVLENLYRRRWTEYDGLGALILSPTRELAIQIFDVLRKVGRNHTFSAGLVIGGKNVQEERERLGRMNILVATPGRILQHLDQNAELDVGSLQLLVLDEADRIMDMGFQSTVDAIVDHLPRDRQTLLFSATQTKKVSDLARLSLQDPEFVSVQEESDTATPSQLSQNYVITPLSQKLDTLWSFLRSNAKKKILVFLSSGKQVRFVYEALRHLQPGVPLLHLHGRQRQSARLDITIKFSNSKQACLFSTDVAARGLDFPAVDWVVQIDCPEDADTYIHRVGRTARYNSSGRAVLFLDPSEEQGMLAALKRKNVSNVEEIHVRQKKMQNTIQNQLQNMCFKDPELKYLGQKAFVSYVRSVFVQKDKTIFDVKKLDLEAFAASLGLPGAPRVKFVKGDDVKKVKNMPRALVAIENESSSSSEGDEDDEATGDSKKKRKPEKEKPVRTKYDRMFERRNQDVLADHYAKMIDDTESKTHANADTADADSDDGFMAVKTRYDIDDARLDQKQANSKLDKHGLGQDTHVSPEIGHKPNENLSVTKKVQLSNNPSATPLIVDSNRRAKQLQSRKALLKYKGRGSHLVFSDNESDDNVGREKVHYEKEDTFKARGDAAAQRDRFLEVEREKAQQADVEDREVAREKRREKKIRRKERERGLDVDDNDDEDGGAQLVPYNDVEGLGRHIDLADVFDDDSNHDNDHDDDQDREDGPAEESDSRPPKQKKRRRWSNARPEQEPKQKKQKDTTREPKWFEKNDEAGGSGRTPGQQRNQDRQGRSGWEKTAEYPETLEDMEAMASGLLAR